MAVPIGAVCKPDLPDGTLNHLGNLLQAKFGKGKVGFKNTQQVIG